MLRNIFKSITKYVYIIIYIIVSQVPLEEFGHLIKGLKSGCPPHGGIALGT